MSAHPDLLSWMAEQSETHTVDTDAVMMEVGDSDEYDYFQKLGARPLPRRANTLPEVRARGSLRRSAPLSQLT